MRLKFVKRIKGLLTNRELLTNMEPAWPIEADWWVHETCTARQELSSDFLCSDVEVQLFIDRARRVFMREQELSSDHLQPAIRDQSVIGLNESPSSAWQALSKWLRFPAEMRQLSKWVTDPSLRKIRQLVSQYIGSIPEVMKVVGRVDEEEEGVISICTIIDSTDALLRYRVYEAEEKVIDALPLVSFDFRVVNLSNFPGADISILHEVEGEILYQKVSLISNDEVPFDFTDLPEDVSYAYTGRTLGQGSP